MPHSEHCFCGTAIGLVMLGLGIAVSSMSLAGSSSLGNVDISVRSGVGAGLTYRAQFGLYQVCVGQKMEDGTGLTCFPYTNASAESISRVLPIGSIAVATAAQELASGAMDQVESGAILTTLGIFAALLFILYSVAPDHGFSSGGCSASLACFILVLTAMSLYGSSIQHMALEPIALHAGFVSNASSRWAISIAATENRTILSYSVDGNGFDPEWWPGMLQLYIALVSIFAMGMGALFMGMVPYPASLARTGEEIGCLTEMYISPEDCDKACLLCSLANRRTDAENVDPWVADWWRLFAIPPFGALPIAAAIISTIMAHGPVFSYEATGVLTDPNSSEWSTYARFHYSMNMGGACLTTNVSDIGRRGYTGIDCFQVNAPRRLQLSVPGSANSTATGDDFSAVVLAKVAPTIEQAQGIATMHAGFMAVAAMLFVGASVCNTRHGNAARAFKVWGKAVGVLLVALGLVGIINTATIESLRGSLTSEPLLADWSEASIKPTASKFGLLERFTHPIAGPLQFHLTRAVVEPYGSEGDDLITASTVLTVLSALMMMPVGAILMIGTMDGNGTVVPRAAEGRSGTGPSAVDDSARDEEGEGGGGSPVKGGAGAEVSAADRAAFGSLVSVANRDRRQALQSEATTLVGQVEQIRSRGLDESIVDSLLDGKDSKVATRTREMLAAKARDSSAAEQVKVAPGGGGTATAVAPPPNTGGTRLPSVAPHAPAALTGVNPGEEGATFAL